MNHDIGIVVTLYHQRFSLYPVLSPLHESTPTLARVRDIRTRFTKEEAEALIGRPVRAKLAIDGMPAGATGCVVQIDEMERGLFDVIVEWHMLVEGKRQHNWFSKHAYDQQILEVEEVARDVIKTED